MEILETVTFDDAIAFTESIMTKMVTGELTSPEITEAIASLVKTKNGARGFFVTYLTSDSTLADNPSPEVITALESSPEIVAELLVKNLAMSAAMGLKHRRNGKEEMAQGSDRVRSRSANLIKQLNMPSLFDIAQQLRQSALTGVGNYQEFLQRWRYDSDQKQVIHEALSDILDQ
ncbi:hypothetical protein BJP36_25070 [Moorena producens JHB]|uniref:Uncharacterized protein n=1 Tax=Moorena producens (strain JHB) TaxID=1454205 RepID=A0A1D9G4X4_MOOP1|nr:hypothetical protein [Moorena producens]AOY82699.1 hypothetical protein BJP36_25070 [Moorena producens JHB]